jgi:hypothetical protein
LRRDAQGRDVLPSAREILEDYLWGKPVQSAA